LYALSKPLFRCVWPIVALTAHQPLQLPHAPHLRIVKVNINLILQTFYLGIFVVNTHTSTEYRVEHVTFQQPGKAYKVFVHYHCDMWNILGINYDVFFLCRKRILQRFSSHITHQHPCTLYSSDVMHTVRLRLRLQCVFHYCIYLPLEYSTLVTLWFKILKLNYLVLYVYNQIVCRFWRLANRASYIPYLFMRNLMTVNVKKNRILTVGILESLQYENIKIILIKKQLKKKLLPTPEAGH